MKISQFFTQFTQSQTQKEGVKIGNSIMPVAEKTDESQTVTTSQQQKISKLLSKYNLPQTNENKTEIDTFFKTAQGTDEDKLTTLETALSKGIEPTNSNLMALHSALNDSALTSEQVDLLAVQPNVTSEDEKKIIAALKVPDKVKALLLAMAEKGYSLKESVAMLSLALGGQKSTSIQGFLQQVKALSTSEIETLVTNLATKLNLEGALTNDSLESLERVTQEHTNLLDINVDSKMSAREHSYLSDAFISNDRQEIVASSTLRVSETHQDSNDLSQGARDHQTLIKMGIPEMKDGDIKSAVDKVSEPLDYEITNDTETGETSDLAKVDENFNAIVMEALTQISDRISELQDIVEIKSYLVKETTALGIEMKSQFEDFKAEVAQILDQTKAETPKNTADLVSKAIETIDKMITRKEVTLYSTMQTERDLLVTSSNLKEASNLLVQGKVQEAIVIVDKANETVKQLFFDPDKRMVQLFVTQKADMTNNILEKDVDQGQLKIQNILSQLQDQQGKHHARDVVETLRFMGNNHETEVVNIIEGKDKSESQALIKENIKEILLKMSKEEGEQRTVTSTEKSLMNLSGQQMLNDSQQDGKKPFYFFNYPIQEADEINEMKVYVSGNQNKQKVDWQNSELYFGVNLKTLGDAGIKIKINNGAIDIQVRNDQHEIIAEALAQYADDLKTIGYESVSVSGRSFKAENPLRVEMEERHTSSKEESKDGRVDLKV